MADSRSWKAGNFAANRRGNGMGPARVVAETPERTGSSTVAIAAAPRPEEPAGTRVKVNAAKRWTNHVAMNYDSHGQECRKAREATHLFTATPWQFLLLLSAKMTQSPIAL
jgi:hypothetical protein